MEADSSVRVVVMEGAGDKAFCAGGDIRGTLKCVETAFRTLFKTIKKNNGSFMQCHTFTRGLSTCIGYCPAQTRALYYPVQYMACCMRAPAITNLLPNDVKLF